MVKEKGDHKIKNTAAGLNGFSHEAAVVKAARAVLENREFEYTARAIYDVCKEVIGAAAGYVALASPDGEENELLFLDEGGLECAVDSGLPMPLRGLRGVAYSEKRTVIENNFSESEWMRFMPPGHARLENVLFAPLILHDRAVGVIGLSNKPGGFNEGDAQLATVLGEIAAVALSNSRFLDALERSEFELKIRNKIAHIFLTVSDEDMYGEVLSLVLELMDSQFGIFGYIDKDGNLVCPSMTRDVWDKCRVSNKSAVFPKRVWSGLWGQSLLEKKTFLSEGPFKIPEGHLGIKNLLTVPIVHQSRLIGSLQVANKNGPYNERDKKLMETIADYISPILRARLQRDEEERERKRVEQKLRERQKRILELNAGLKEQVSKEVEKGRQKDLLLMHQARLAAMGEMVGLIAHQWRQPLNVLNLLLFNIQDVHSMGQLDEGLLKELTSKGSNIIAKMSSTIEDFRNFFKPQDNNIRFSINKVVNESLELVDASLRFHNISVRLKAGEDVFAEGVPNEYSQVMLSLLNNAKDAIVDKGTAGEIQIDIGRDSHSGIVRVRDNGGGIPDEYMGRIFQPYFSGKADKEGTGLGLYLCKVIVEDHMKGLITAKNSDGGAEFTIATPL